jgi:hypothetical protein
VINKIKCKIKGHDEKWWLKGEIGHMRGVRFVMSNKEPQVER